ncbi:hypothetical protein CTKA_00018 [Chthonomonas calidirosea]|uniref:Uncharacterized protein n=1 Tax=Chthonomonas calidirosea (strain DSM 23976 / ICMP 18418 / T49) TaxID=1303518 RepID=S0EUH5_CHTCT|nr:hypothetical protein [Chthonomonas calidirosea]CCW34960.1 hypothetical protein CCALI_01141 [Chthonomonas calidirosea T49]CEK13297.1 hypothetical protein CTKA_00018 [Chthonomonas calidirosea]
MTMRLWIVGFGVLLIGGLLLVVLRSFLRLQRRIERFLLTERDDLARRDPYQALLEETAAKEGSLSFLPRSRKPK